MLPRIASHIRRAKLVTSCKDLLTEAKEFYHKIFPTWQRQDKNDEARFLCLEDLHIVLEREGHLGELRPGWIPEIAVQRSQLQNLEITPSLIHPELSPVGKSAGKLWCRGPQDIQFIAVDAETEISEDQESAPFALQPRTPGVVNWSDLAVDDGTEREMAQFCFDAFGWNMCTSLEIPGGGVYITCLNSSGNIENRHKLCGIVPRNMLVKGHESSDMIPMFCIAGEKELEEANNVAISNGGTTLLPTTEADGFISILHDPWKNAFGLYYRTDEWSGVKPTTVLCNDFI